MKVVSITDHGAVGDGKTDCLAAVQAAFAVAAAADEPAVVYVPEGVYLVANLKPEIAAADATGEAPAAPATD